MMIKNKEHREILARLIREEIAVLEYLLAEDLCDPEEKELNEIKKIELEQMLGMFI